MAAGCVCVVSGLPRSGTSLAMGLLQAGGMPIFSDEIRQADLDNPNGYFEYAGAGGLQSDNAWVYDSVGKAVKVISPLLRYLPSDLQYLIVFMRRNVREISLSQEQMLRRRGHPIGKNSGQIEEIMRAHIDQVETWLSEQRNMSVCYMDYKWVVGNSVAASRKLVKFVQLQGDPAEMAEVVNKSLYRQKVTGGE